MGIYFGLSIHDLKNYVRRLDQRLNSEENFSDIIARNTKAIYNDTEVVALQTNMLQADFHHFAQWSTCKFFRLSINERKSVLYGTMNLLASDVISGKLTTRVIPISLLQDILKNNKLLHGTLLAQDPLMLYQTATISLVSVDKKKRRISILIAIPSVISITSLKAVVNNHRRPH